MKAFLYIIMTAGILTCAYDLSIIIWGLIIKPAIKLIKKSRNMGWEDDLVFWKVIHWWLERRFLKSHATQSKEKKMKSHTTVDIELLVKSCRGIKKSRFLQMRRFLKSHTTWACEKMELVLLKVTLPLLRYGNILKVM